MKVLLAVAALALPPIHPAQPIQPVNSSCGLQPIAPRGCQVNTCVCDSLGTNCHWLYFCGFCCGYNSAMQPIQPYLPNYGNVVDMFRRDRRSGGAAYSGDVSGPRSIK